MTTRSIFNFSTRLSTDAGTSTAPPPVRRILIVGGGTAGWMTALIFARNLIPKGVEIILLESPTVPTIGVGEGSTPRLREFFDWLGIDESEWMPACHATYKCGISFERWSTKHGFERYFHPFPSMVDMMTLTQFIHNAEARLRGANLYAHPDRFFLASRLAAERRAPKSHESFPFDVFHAYHFDATLLGQFLHKKAIERGVRYKSCHVTHAAVAPDSSIASVSTREGETLTADLYVDCTGFTGLLLQKTLRVPFVSFADNLFNDAAVAMPSPIEEHIPSETVATALKHGWAWKIPLTERYGNGYVYSTRFCTPDAAETELRQHLGLLDSAVEARHIKMKVGRVAKPWHTNCLAIGLAQSFIEPLEATALSVVQYMAQMFTGLLERGELTEDARARFNEGANISVEGIRDYIVTHYKTNSRTDTDYWRANAANMILSDNLRKLYSLWHSGKSIAPAVRTVQIFPVMSWYGILSGMGVFPDPNSLRPPAAQEARYNLAEVDELMNRCVRNFFYHREALQHASPSRNQLTLQLYFW
jgi:2-polyprenyl-6-methoxyphenol hydroxylase-like FAD-dependent oxidoreductase